MREEAGTGERLWYRMESKGEDEAEVYIYDEISLWGVTSDRFVRDMKSLVASTIHLRINSPGGNVFDGMTIFNALREHPARVISHIDGLAASMASLVALAGDEVRMAENAFFMVHNPYVFMAGDARELRKSADLLDKVGEAMAKIYAAKTAKSRAVVQAWMDEESWFSAKEAKAAGFVDEVDGESDEQARFDPNLYGFANAPAALGGNRNVEGMTEREFEGFLRDAGFSKSQAVAITRGGYPAIGRGDPGLGAVEELLRKNIMEMKG